MPQGKFRLSGGTRPADSFVAPTNHRFESCLSETSGNVGAAKWDLKSALGRERFSEAVPKQMEDDPMSADPRAVQRCLGFPGAHTAKLGERKAEHLPAGKQRPARD
jgi:hypothetical protein